MSATSADQGRSLDVDRNSDKELQPGLGWTEGNSAFPASKNFASSNEATDVVDIPDRPSTAIRISASTDQVESSTSKSKARLEPAPDRPQSSSGPREQEASKENKNFSSPSDPAPSGPVLVNPGLPPALSGSSSSRSTTMHVPLAPYTVSRSQRGAKRQPKTLPQAPSPASFSFASILSSLSSDPTTQSDIDAIAEICGRSRLSMANEYTAHREPVGPGIDPVRVGEDGAEFERDDDGPGDQRLVLDTSGAGSIYRTGATELETVDEAPTPISEGSRGHQLGGDTYGSNSANPSRSPTASAVSEEMGITSRWGFLDVWERGTRLGRGRAAGTSLDAVEVNAIGEAESFGVVGPNPELRDDISGPGGSRAVRQLMRVAGG